MTRLLDGAGLKVERIRRIGKYASPLLILNRLARYARPLRHAEKLASRLHVQGLAVPVDPLDILIAFATKQ
jgi:hypothetical protein